MTYSGFTHWVDYSPHNLGSDAVTSACGKRVHVTEFSALPTCQRCPMTDHIPEFVGQYWFLSNFYIEPDGTHVEGEYQACKTDPPSHDLMKGVSPKQAKAMGARFKRNGLLRRDWNHVSLAIMERIVRQKFTDHPRLARQLKATGRAYLEEGNWWGDRFWGTVDGVGENHLGRILMKIRGEL